MCIIMFAFFIFNLELITAVFQISKPVSLTLIFPIKFLTFIILFDLTFHCLLGLVEALIPVGLKVFNRLVTRFCYTFDVICKRLISQI